MTLHRSILAALLAACLWLVAGAAAAQPAAEVFFKEPDIAEAVLSPSGRLLAVTSAKGLPRAGLTLIDLGLGPGQAITRVAQFANSDVINVQWVNDERLIFSLNDDADGTGKAGGAPGLFAVNRDGSQLRQFVRRRGEAGVGSGDSKLLDWNHRVLRVPSPVPGQLNDSILIARFDLHDQEQTPLWLNVRTGQTRSIDTQAPPHVVAWWANDRGELNAALTVADGKQAAYWRPRGSSGWTRLYESGLFDAPYDLAGEDNAGTLFVTPRTGLEGYRTMTRYDAKAGKPEEKLVVQTPGFDFSGWMLNDPGSGQALGVRAFVDGEVSVWFDPQMKALQAEADRLFPARVNSISCRRCGAADMVALVRSFSDHDPGRLYLYRAQPAEGDKAWSRVGPVRADVNPEQMASLALHRIKARDGRGLPVWVTRPDDAAGPLPAVVLVHRGPWTRGRYWGWQSESQFLASRGYVVIEPEMRGSLGYGKAHFEAGFKQWGQAMQQDVADALRWAQQEGLASERACIAGAGYGGYSALMGLANDAGLFRCGVASFAITDLDLYARGSWWVRDGISEDGRRHYLPELVGDPVKDAAMLAAHSPVNLASRIKAPVLLLSGQKNMEAPLAHAERMRRALAQAGNEPQWWVYEDEGNRLGSLKNRVDHAQRMEAFLARHLKP